MSPTKFNFFNLKYIFLSYRTYIHPTQAKEDMKRKPEEVEEIKHSLWVTAERSMVEFRIVRGQEFQKVIICCEWRWHRAWAPTFMWAIIFIFIHLLKRWNVMAKPERWWWSTERPHWRDCSAGERTPRCSFVPTVTQPSWRGHCTSETHLSCFSSRKRQNCLVSGGGQAAPSSRSPQLHSCMFITPGRRSSTSAIFNNAPSLVCPSPSEETNESSALEDLWNICSR